MPHPRPGPCVRLHATFSHQGDTPHGAVDMPQSRGGPPLLSLPILVDAQPLLLIKRSLIIFQANSSVGVMYSSHGAALLSFPSREIRWNVIAHRPIKFEGNTLTFERPEHADNRDTTNFEDLQEIKASDFPPLVIARGRGHLLLQPPRVVCMLDPYCFGSGEFVSVPALFMVIHGKRLHPHPPRAWSSSCVIVS
ncbi:hypothetical protein D1007_49455 [Hordeum vulgare]|nr:hypothetical protein D1007_49455 [Hordeum vulgare]